MKKMVGYLLSIFSIGFVVVSTVLLISDNKSDKTAIIEILLTFLLALILQVLLPYISTRLYFKRKRHIYYYYLPSIIVIAVFIPICIVFLLTIPSWDALYFGLLIILLVLSIVQSIGWQLINDY